MNSTMDWLRIKHVRDTSSCSALAGSDYFANAIADIQDMAKENLSSAKAAKNDEFYTQYSDIEKEMNAYLDFDKDTFKDAVMLLPCDDPEWSNFTKYFAQNFKKLGLKKLMSTSYAPNLKSNVDNYQPPLFELESDFYDAEKSMSKGKIFILTKDENEDGKIDIHDLNWEYLEGDGDFRSEEVKKLRDEATHIITNPPFSLFREFIAWVTEKNKKFALIGNMNAITYKEVFPLIKSNKLWLGVTNFNNGMYFFVPENFVYSETYKFEKEVDGKKVSRVPGVCWFTNIDHGRRHEPLKLMTKAENMKFNKTVKEQGYPKYDNYNAIEVSKVESIPSDEKGVMGVPITFLSKYNPEQFEILDYPDGKVGPGQWIPVIGDTTKYARILIKHKTKKATK